ncbi:ATP-binding cassette subfamily G member 4-like isoform X2 [Lycorma delicatula]|uniref:ATP-binding cassette subfamily G member 4-like isoform X2 n=1 Tax=Lycorma delicatula TaxID=130591 RepID=UPI003F51A9AC
MSESVVEVLPCAGDGISCGRSDFTRPLPPVVTRIPTRVELTTLTRMAKRPAVDIEFQDLSYTADRRKIIKSISGCFKSGEMTAIMGPSGAGKSTLMNILVGYVTNGVTGSILTNGFPRQIKLFNKLSSYIMQEDLLQPNLTVKESMVIAAKLKLGNELSDSDKNAAVEEILKTLGLTACADTYTEKLSGGQRKRVSVGLELVNNPPVIFLDEPTTGLDIVTMNHCVQLLKNLSRQGRTIVCTIHQPTASMFNMFDNVYMLAKGMCVYQGSSQQLVPFLASCGLQCPSSYNPADYVFEVLQFDIIKVMTAEIQNGRVVRFDPRDDKEPRSKLYNNDSNCNGDGGDYNSAGDGCSDNGRKETIATMPSVFGSDSDALQFPTSYFEQVFILLTRMLKQKWRNSTALSLQLIHHIFSGIVIGAIFLGVGNNASKPFENFKFVLCVAVFFMYTHVITHILTLPNEVKLLKREYFNRWYGLKAHFTAHTLHTIPTTVSLTMIFNFIVYFMADEPLEVGRFLWFSSFAVGTALVAEGLGVLIGSNFNCTNGAVVGPSIMASILMVSIHGMGYGLYITQFMQNIMKLSFLRFSLVGMITCLYQNGRAPLECKDEIHPYCHYKDPYMLVRDLGMAKQNIVNQIFGLIGYLLLFRLVAFLSLRYNLTLDFRSHVFGYAKKMFKRK